jgi:hypothetical protein
MLNSVLKFFPHNGGRVDGDRDSPSKEKEAQKPAHEESKTQMCAAEAANLNLLHALVALKARR